MKSCDGNNRSYDARSISARNSIAARNTPAPSIRAVEAGTLPEENTHTCAPSPERDRSSTAGTPLLRHTSTYANASSVHDAPSKSHTRSRHASPRSNGYSPTDSRPARCASITSSVNGRCSRPGLRAFAHPPLTAGDHPAFRVDAFSHRNAYTSSRPTNNDRNNATFSARDIGPSPIGCELRPFGARSPPIASANSVGSHAAAGALSAALSKPNNDRSRSFSALNTSISTIAATNRASPAPSSADRINQGYAASDSHPRGRHVPRNTPKSAPSNAEQRMLAICLHGDTPVREQAPDQPLRETEIVGVGPPPNRPTPPVSAGHGPASMQSPIRHFEV